MDIQTEKGLRKALSYLESGNPDEAKKVLDTIRMYNLESKELILSGKYCLFWSDALLRLSDIEDSYERGERLLAEWKNFLDFIRQQQQSSGSSDGYIWPSNNSHLITDSYGWRICPFHGREFHNGIDIDARRGTDLQASSPGTVIQSGWNGGYGISVMISHPDGITTLYGHMSSTKVSVGQTVSKGQVIGACGSTGNSTGPHIHYTMYKGSGTLNPLNYLPGYIPYDW